MKSNLPCLVAMGAMFLVRPQMEAQSGGTSSSPNYYLLQASPGSPGGGGPVTNGAETIVAEISLGDAEAGTPGEITVHGVLAKPNLIGQFYDPRELAVSGSPASVNERSTRQLSAQATMDDHTTLILTPDQVAWSETSAALTGISNTGLATAASVYQNEVATVHGIYQGIADPDGFDLSVINTGADDFGTYAVDGIDDDWQVGWFGLPPNSAAGPDADPDGDQQDNRFEFLSGFSPIDPLARFELKIVAVNRATGTADLQLNRVIPNRIYTLMTSPDLVTPFVAIGNLPAVTEPESDKTIRDSSATGVRKFYIIGITQP
jgi:hypothetical protein